MLSVLPSSKTSFIISVDTDMIPSLTRGAAPSIETGENFERKTIADTDRPEDKTTFVGIERNKTTIDLLAESFFSSGSGLERHIALKRFEDVADSRYFSEVLDRNSNQYCIHLINIAKNNHAIQQTQDNPALTLTSGYIRPVTSSMFHYNEYPLITHSLQIYSTTPIYTAYESPKDYISSKDVYAPQREIRAHQTRREEHEIILKNNEPIHVYIPQQKVEAYAAIKEGHEIILRNSKLSEGVYVPQQKAEIYATIRNEPEIISRNTIQLKGTNVYASSAETKANQAYLEMSEIAKAISEHAQKPSVFDIKPAETNLDFLAGKDLYSPKIKPTGKETTTIPQEPDRLVTMVLSENPKIYEPLFPINLPTNSSERPAATEGLTTVTLDLYKSSARKTETYNTAEQFLLINKDKITIKPEENYKPERAEEEIKQHPKERQLESVVEEPAETGNSRAYKEEKAREETTEKLKYEKIAEGAFAVYSKILGKDDLKSLDGFRTIEVLDAKTKVSKKEQIANNSVFALLYNTLAKDGLMINEYSYVDTETKKQAKGWMLELEEEKGWGYIIKINGVEPTYAQGTLSPLLDIKAREGDKIEFLKIKQGDYLDKEAKTLCGKVPVKKKDAGFDDLEKEIAAVFKGYSHDFSHAELRARLGTEYTTKYFIDGREVSPDTKIMDSMLRSNINLEAAIMSGKGIEDIDRHIPKGAEEIFYKRVNLSDLAYLNGSAIEIEVRDKKSESFKWKESVENDSVFSFIYHALGNKGVVVKNDTYTDTKTGEKKEGWIYESPGDNGNNGYIVKINGKEPAYRPGTKNPLLDIKVKEGDQIQVLKVKQGLYFDHESETKCGKIPVEKRKINALDIGKSLWELSLWKELVYEPFDIKQKIGDNYTTRYFLNKKDAALNTVIDSSMINMEYESAIMSEPAVKLPYQQKKEELMLVKS